MSAPPATLGLGKGRIEALSDGIFATVMTVLVLSLSIPTITGSTNSAIATYVAALWPIILSYVMSFLILAVYWVRHHNIFHFIARLDNTLVWINMIFLLTVGFVPFSTELIGRYWDTQVSTIIYGSNLIASGITMQVMWQYAYTRKLMIVDNLDERVMARVNRRLLGGPVLYLVAILFSLAVPDGTEIAVGIYVLTLAYYVSVSSLGRGRPWQLPQGAPTGAR